MLIRLRARATRLVLVAPAALGACAPDGGEPNASETSATAAADALRAVGYATWDEDADSTRSGVTLLDRARAAPGVNIHTDDVDRVLARDLDGRVVHEWRVPGRTRCEHAELLPGGRVAVVSVDEGVTLLEHDSRLVWHADLAAHHDLAPLADGGFLVPVHEERELLGRRVRFDGIVRLDQDGEARSWWSSWERRAELAALHEPTPLDALEGPRDGTGAEAPETVYDYYHLNAVEVLPAVDVLPAVEVPRGAEHGKPDARFAAGNVLVCLRNVNLVLVLDGESGDVVWSWGPGELDAPHTPSLTPAGTLLVFDNGRRRGWSRLVEIDPRTGTIVWDWRAAPPEAFFSDVRGSAQRLPNGNTLVCESQRGRAFELTPEGTLVWELWNPEVVGERRKRIYRVTRVPLELLDPARSR